jgi:steroid 5-alpha reductase family enzyme
VSGRPRLYLIAVGAKSGRPAVTPQTLTGEDRATAWERITRERPNFAAYEQKTDRVIPVVRLSAR